MIFFYCYILIEMQSEISLLTFENDFHSNDLQGLNYSFSDYSEALNSTKKSGNTSNQKPKKFARKKSRSSTEEFQNKIRSVEKINQSNCSTSRDDQNSSKVTTTREKPATQKTKVDTFKNMYKLEHRNKNAPTKNFFNKQNARKSNLNLSAREAERSKGFGSGIRYYPMADVLNYNEKPLKNQTMIQRRLFNKIQKEMSYY